MIPLSQTLLLSSYPRANAGTAMAIWSMTTLVAPVAGPAARRLDHRQHLVAVDLLHQRTRRPIAAVVAWSMYRSATRRPQRLPIDNVGLTLLVIWVGACLQVMLDKGKELDWFGSTRIVVLRRSPRSASPSSPGS